jgi:rhodanese-related sulfurtransferase
VKLSLPWLPDPAETLEIQPRKVAVWVDLPIAARPRLIDCREQDELAICQIAGNEWIPLGLFPGVREALLARNENGVVVYCHHGIRSMQATQFLRSIGVENAFSMSGGVEAWAQQIDPEMRRY